MRSADRRVRLGASPASSTLAPAAVITGATQGIGRALADEFAKTGHTLLLVARTEATLAKTASEVSAQYNIPVHTVACDLSTAEGCDRVAETRAIVSLMSAYNKYLVTSGIPCDITPA